MQHELGASFEDEVRAVLDLVQEGVVLSGLEQDHRRGLDLDGPVQDELEVVRVLSHVPDAELPPLDVEVQGKVAGKRLDDL